MCDKSQGVYSIGENLFKNLNEYAKNEKLNEKSNEKLNEFNVSNEFDTLYAIESRLANFYKNNPYTVLDESQKYSGLKDEKGNNTPLGGQIDYNKNNINNRDGSKYHSSEFDFWNLHNMPNSKKNQIDKDLQKPYTETQNEQNNEQNNKQNNKQNDKEEFNILNNKKENLGKSPNIVLIIFILAVIFILVVFGALIYFDMLF